MKTLIVCSIAAVLALAAVHAGPVLLHSYPSESHREDLTRLLLDNRFRLQYAGPFEGVMTRNEYGGWSGVFAPRIFPSPFGTCDDDDDCEAAASKLCNQNGHGDKVKNIETTDEACFATCDDGSGAQAFIFCDPDTP